MIISVWFIKNGQASELFSISKLFRNLYDFMGYIYMWLRVVAVDNWEFLYIDHVE